MLINYSDIMLGKKKKQMKNIETLQTKYDPMVRWNNTKCNVTKNFMCIQSF